MDDTRTQQALDQLADLFLTGQGPASNTTAPPAEPRRDELVGPAPIRLRPKLTEKPKPVDPPKPAPPIEGNAPLRLQPEPQDDDSPLASIGDIDHPQTPSDAPSENPNLHIADDDTLSASEETADRSIAVEAVILGNLPGLSGPWLTQYAQLLAQQEGPVAILHVDDDLVDLELVEPTNRDAPDRGVSLRMPPGGGQIDPRSILEALLDSQHSPDSVPGTVLVHLDPQHDDQGLARALAIDDWTLMCGADDLAIVAGYKMLKVMVEQDPDVAHKRIGLMIMGSDPKPSQDAARKFQSASESFLNTPVQLLGWQKQMVPVNLRHLGRFEDVDTVWPRLVEWFDLFAVAEPEPEMAIDTAISEPAPPASPPQVMAPIVTPQPKPIETPEPVEHSAGEVPRPTRSKLSELFTDPPPAAVPPSRVQPATPPVPIAPAKPAVAKAPEPAAAPLPEPVAHARPVAQPAAAVGSQNTHSPASDGPNLVELLMAGHGAVPGGIALEARCPHQNQTQLMLDQDGRLHLLCRHDSDGFDSLQSAMVDLLQARHWVHEHMELLALTQRQCKFDTACQPVLHLFTDRADWATALIARLGEALKLHLLQEVRVGSESAWFCTPLN